MYYKKSDTKMVDEKALVKITGEILDVEGYYSVRQMTFSLPIELEETFKDMEWNLPSVDIKSDKIPEIEREGDYYKLSNGKKYIGDELIVGLNKIRDFKFKNILG